MTKPCPLRGPFDLIPEVISSKAVNNIMSILFLINLHVLLADHCDNMNDILHCFILTVSIGRVITNVQCLPWMTVSPEGFPQT